jgi:hypothetical protein
MSPICPKCKLEADDLLYLVRCNATRFLSLHYFEDDIPPLSSERSHLSGFSFDVHFTPYYQSYFKFSRGTYITFCDNLHGIDHRYLCRGEASNLADAAP